MGNEEVHRFHSRRHLPTSLNPEHQVYDQIVELVRLGMPVAILCLGMLAQPRLHDLLSQ
jgi:hypothetical protein